MLSEMKQISAREQARFMARIANQAQRYDELEEHMTTIAKMNVEFTEEERRLFSWSFQNHIGSQRASWRVIRSIEERKVSNREWNASQCSWARKYISRVEDDMRRTCSRVFNIINAYLLPSSTHAGAKVYFLKMKAHYHQYIAEIAVGDERAQSSQAALSAYNQALAIAQCELHPTNPMRLSLMLNLSVFYFEILQQPWRACQISKKAFDDALKLLDNIPDENFKEATIIMQHLRDNLVLWTDELMLDYMPSTEDEGREHQALDDDTL